MTLRPVVDRTWLAIVLVVSAAIFTVGVAVERSTVHTDTHAASSSISSATTSGEQPSTSGGAGTDSHTTSSGETSSRHVEGKATGERGAAGETIFGLNPESTGLVAAVIAVSLALALAVWLVDLPAVLLLVLVFGLGAAIFDGREVIFQAQASRGTLVFFAALTALLHVGVAFLAWRIWQRSSHQSAPVLSHA